MCSSTSTTPCHEHAMLQDQAIGNEHETESVGPQRSIEEMLQGYMPTRMPSHEAKIRSLHEEIIELKDEILTTEWACDQRRDTVQIMYYRCLEMDKQRKALLAEADEIDKYIDTLCHGKKKVNSELLDLVENIGIMKQDVIVKEDLMRNLIQIEEGRLGMLAEMGEAEMKEAEKDVSVVDTVDTIAKAIKELELLTAELNKLTPQPTVAESNSKAPIQAVAKGVEMSVLDQLN